MLEPSQVCSKLWIHAVVSRCYEKSIRHHNIIAEFTSTITVYLEVNTGGPELCLSVFRGSILRVMGHTYELGQPRYCHSRCLAAYAPLSLRIFDAIF